MYRGEKNLMSQRLYKLYEHLMSSNLIGFNCPIGWEPILESFLEFVHHDCLITESDTKVIEVKRIRNTLVIYLEKAPDHVWHRAYFCGGLSEKYCPITGAPIRSFTHTEETWKT